MIVLGAVVLVLALGGLAVAVWLLSRRPRYTLTLHEAGGTGLEFPVRDREATLGSADGRTLSISHPKVDELHAVLTVEDGNVVLRNRSRRGTTVNGKPVEETVLRSGDLLSLAESVDLIFTRLR